MYNFKASSESYVLSARFDFNTWWITSCTLAGRNLIHLWFIIGGEVRGEESEYKRGEREGEAKKNTLEKQGVKLMTKRLKPSTIETSSLGAHS